MMTDPYTSPGSQVLKNKLGLDDPEEFERAERLAVVQRTIEGPPSGNFDLAHLQSIHRHLFQDVYEWAGELRTVDIGKGDTQFQPASFIEAGMNDVHRRLIKKNFLSGLSPEQFAKEAGAIIGDVNFVHPFREGNGRTQLEFLRQLGQRAGHDVNPDKLDPATWKAASIAAVNADYSLMADAILNQAMATGDDADIDPAIALQFMASRGGVGR